MIAITEHAAHTAYYLALIVLGALISGPAWTHYTLKQEEERAKWRAQRREREARRQQAGGIHGRPRAG